MYKTTCLVTGKFYVGKHVGCAEDGYLGSGKQLRSAIEEYGRENFTVAVLGTYSTAEKMNLAERIFVVIDSEVSYNLTKGGRGSFSHIHASGYHWISTLSTRERSELGKHANSHLPSEHFVRIGKVGRPLGIMAAKSPGARVKRVATFKRIKHQQGFRNSQYGKPRSEETKRRISAGVRARLAKDRV